MKQQDFLDLILSSQTTIKQDLLPKHAESKYQLLMLQRSFELLRHYLTQQHSYQQERQHALTTYFQMPVEDIEEGIKQLAQELRHEANPKVLKTLRQLNCADLAISHPKVIKND